MSHSASEQDSTPQKRCNGCQQEKDATLVFFSSDRSKPDRLSTLCKFCRSPEGKKWRDAEKAKNAPPDGYKRCKLCNKLELATAENFASQHSHQCRECVNARDKASYIPKKPAVPPGKRYCTACEKIFPATLEYFHALKGKLNSVCKTCRKQYEDERCQKQEHVERIEKRCTGCGKMKPATTKYFGRRSRSKDGLYYRCKVCESQYDKSDYARNGEKIRVHASVYRARTYETHKEHRHTYHHTYHQNHREQFRLYGHNRRIRIKGAIGAYTTAQIKDLLKRQRYKCYYCREKFKKSQGEYRYTIDHTFPISRASGGEPINDIGYLVLACKPCNSRKRNKYPWEWPEGNRLM